MSACFPCFSGLVWGSSPPVRVPRSGNDRDTPRHRMRVWASGGRRRAICSFKRNGMNNPEYPGISRTRFDANGRVGPEQAGSVGEYMRHGKANGKQEVGTEAPWRASETAVIC